MKPGSVLRCMTRQKITTGNNNKSMIYLEDTKRTGL